MVDHICSECGWRSTCCIRSRAVIELRKISLNSH